MSKVRKTVEGNNYPSNRLLALGLVTVLVGIASGIGGMLSALLLKFIQHLAYGYSPFELVSNETFLQGVSDSSPLRRVLVLSICGLVAGFGWYTLFRYGQPLVGVTKALRDTIPLPPVSTFMHALLQLITIALGSPLGREAAPREIGAVFAQWLSDKAGLSRQDTHIMLACGAGAGFAAVYNVPLGGALFTLEVLWGNFHWSALIPAFATAAIATVISWIGLGNETQYVMASYTINNHVILWSALCGPVFGLGAYWFIQLTNRARRHPSKNWRLPMSCFINYLMIGCLAIYFPALLGNGKSPARLEFANEMSIGLSLTFLILRTLIVSTSLRAGSYGGLLTPSFANGALLGVALGGIFNLVWPGTSLNAFAVIGATAFLAAAQKMPLTAIVLIFEFTQIDFRFLVPILFAVTGSIFVFHLFTRNGPGWI